PRRSARTATGTRTSSRASSARASVRSSRIPRSSTCRRTWKFPVRTSKARTRRRSRSSATCTPAGCRSRRRLKRAPVRADTSCMPWRTPAAVALLAAVALCAAGRASGDHATVSPQAVAPWTGGDAVVTPLEALAGRIATRIAQHPVTVNCETASKFRALAGSRDVLGFVRALTDRSTGRYAETATVIELTSQVCGPLQRFAEAAMKPTRCKAGNGRFVPCFTGKPVPQGALVEQQADCYGMQWVPWVAYELGDTGRDTQAIADYFWLAEYPL